ncbi:MAG: hypothetical protein IJL87_07445, partial [Clostridia bacterium]|nr:hypothetical protein [Clostridia bacterium]
VVLEYSEGKVELAKNVTPLPFTKDEFGSEQSFGRSRSEAYPHNSIAYDNGTYLYLTLPKKSTVDGGYALYRIDKKGKKTRVTNGFIHSIYEKDGVLYYLRKIETTINDYPYIYNEIIMNKNGKETKLAECRDFGFVYCRDFMLYNDEKDCKSLKIEYGKTKPEAVPEGRYEYEYKNMIYYYDDSKGDCVTDPDFTSSKSISTGGFGIKNDCIYCEDFDYTSVDSSRKIDRYNPETGEREELIAGLNENSANFLTFSDEYMILPVDNAIYRIGEKFDKLEKIFEADSAFMCDGKKGNFSYRYTSVSGLYVSDNKIVAEFFGEDEDTGKYYSKCIVLDPDGKILFTSNRCAH